MADNTEKSMRESILKPYANTLSNAIQDTISRTLIVDYGIIKKVQSSGIVDVVLSVTGSKNFVQVVTCVYVNIASDTFSLKIAPKEGDKVLVMSPRKFSPAMFDVDKDEPIYSKFANGYNLFSCIAVPLCQFKTDTDKNYISFEDGAMTVKMSYDKDNEDKINTIVVDSSGITVTDKNNNKVEMTDSGVTVTDKNDNKVEMTDSGIVVTDKNDNSIEMTDSGMTIEDTNGCKIETSSTSVKINGNLEIKK